MVEVPLENAEEWKQHSHLHLPTVIWGITSCDKEFFDTARMNLTTALKK